MRFGILGPFEIVGADAPAPITGAKRRALLALLVVVSAPKPAKRLRPSASP